LHASMESACLKSLSADVPQYPASISSHLASLNPRRSAKSFRPKQRSMRRRKNVCWPLAMTGIDGRIPVAMALAERKSYGEHRPVRLEEVGG
jgi:hypothetical protein